MSDGLNIRGTVTLASGDNLGSCYIGGYKAPSGAFCVILYGHLQ